MKDPATGALDRAQFAADLDVIFARGEQRDFCLALFDLDHFKRFNLHNGHAAGDELLGRLLAIVSPVFASGDAFYRVGGGEFALLLATPRLADAARRGEQLRARVEAHLTPAQRAHCGDPDCQGPSPRVTVSGAVLTLEPYSSRAALTQAAEELLFTAKRGGRNRIASPPPITR